jgi:DNA-binding transcriptional LysR family regulator
LATALHRLDPPALPHASELGSTTTIIATARAGGGVGVVSAHAAAADIAAGTLVELSVSGLALTRDLNAIWTGSKPPTLGADLIRVATGSNGPRT